MLGLKFFWMTLTFSLIIYAHKAYLVICLVVLFQSCCCRCCAAGFPSPTSGSLSGSLLCSFVVVVAFLLMFVAVVALLLDLSVVAAALLLDLFVVVAVLLFPDPFAVAVAFVCLFSFLGVFLVYLLVLLLLLLLLLLLVVAVVVVLLLPLFVVAVVVGSLHWTLVDPPPLRLRLLSQPGNVFPAWQC